MSADFPPCFFCVDDSTDGEVLLKENKQEVLNLRDGRKVLILIENPATKKPEPVPLTEDQKQNRYFLAVVAFLVFLAICMVCTFFATI